MVISFVIICSVFAINVTVFWWVASWKLVDYMKVEYDNFICINFWNVFDLSAFPLLFKVSPSNSLDGR